MLAAKRMEESKVKASTTATVATMTGTLRRSSVSLIQASKSSQTRLDKLFDSLPHLENHRPGKTPALVPSKYAQEASREIIENVKKLQHSPGRLYQIRAKVAKGKQQEAVAL